MRVLTKKDIEREAGLVSNDLREEILNRLANYDDNTYHCVYTYYGDDILGKVFIEYFKKNYPDNIVCEEKNAFIFGDFDFIGRFIKVIENYLLDFVNLEDCYSDKDW